VSDHGIALRWSIFPKAKETKVNKLKLGCLLVVASLLGACADTGSLKQADIEDRTGGKAASSAGASGGAASATLGTGGKAAAGTGTTGKDVQTSPLGSAAESMQPIGGQQGATALGDGSNPLKDPSSPLSQRSIFFDFDSSVVKDEYRPMLEAHAKYLLATPSAAVILQGNTDERGSREYNLALGQRRSESVFQVLSLLGVPTSQMEAVSFGEEKPHAQGSTEEAWSQNRRTDIVYKGE
jgi:peptidoglycan-associated lipoprotein